MLRVLLGVSIAVLGTSACASATNRAADPVTSATPMTATPSVPADSQLRVSAAGWRTNSSRHEVPLGEIISGGPGKDGIPAIDRPSFVAADGASWLADREPVIAIGLGGEWRAYPIQMLVWHEIVNDVIVDVAVAVTFCPLCHTAIALERTVDGRVLDFGTTGNLRHADLVMYDRQTESWWQQATGRAIVGELAGTQLEFLPSQLVSWAQFRDAHPDAMVLSRDTGHVRDYGSNPYPGYDEIDSDPILLEDTTLIDGRLGPKVRVLGIVVGGDAAAYPFPLLAEHPVVNDTIGGEPIVVVWINGTASGLGAPTVADGEIVGAANAFSRVVDETTLTFAAGDGGTMRDAETGSKGTWDGRAIAGDLPGA